MQDSKQNWCVLGTGPSSKDFVPPEDCLIATVNGGHAIAPRVNAFGIFEIKAALAYRNVLNKFIESRRCAVYVRPVVQRTLDLKHVIVVPKNSGPLALQPLHQDRWFAPEDGTPEYGQHGSWMGSGALMLQLIAHHYRPPVITVVGIDGYRSGDPNPVSQYERTEEWCRHWNRHAGDAISAITNHYTDTRFVFVKRPANSDAGWRAEYLDG